MTQLIMVIIAAVVATSVVWIAARMHAARRERETAELYGHYVVRHPGDHAGLLASGSL